MNVLVIGAAGMVGRKLAQRLLADGALRGQPIAHLRLADAVESGFETASGISSWLGDLGNPSAAQELLENHPEVIFHLAAVVSGEAEQNFEKGYRANYEASQRLFEGIRTAGYRPRVVFASSIAVFGRPFPDPIPEDYATLPLTSYGAQKAMIELLLNDYSRRRYLDGIAIRLPTICVRPGKPNQAASGFFSGIIREPLSGVEARLPVSTKVRHWFASPRSAVGFLKHAAELDTELLQGRRTLSMPGLSITVGEMIDALKRVAGEQVTALIKEDPDPAIIDMVHGWPQALDATRASELGFRAEDDFAQIIKVYLQDELGGRRPRH